VISVLSIIVRAEITTLRMYKVMRSPHTLEEVGRPENREVYTTSFFQSVASFQVGMFLRNVPFIWNGKLTASPTED
jgi:hypothetical protein